MAPHLGQQPMHPDELLRSLIQAARQVFGAAACSLALLSEDESELVYTVAAGAGAAEVTGLRLSSGRGIAGWAVQAGQPIAVSDVTSEPRFARDTAERTGYLPQAVLAAPVATTRRVLGVISLLDRDQGRPGAEQDMALLSLFADQAALALTSTGATIQAGQALLDALAAQDRAAQDGAAQDGAAVTSSLRPAWSDAFAPGTLRPVPGTGLPIDKEWAWGGASGAGITVAVVDSGIDPAHPAVGRVERAVALRWDAGAQEVTSTEGPHEDLFGHGTACAGIIGLAAPDAALWSVRVLGSRLSGKGSVFAAGLRWAISAGARVVNLSLSTGREDYFGLFHEIADEAAFAGVVLVCAVSNIPGPTFPSQFSSVISVAAHDGQDPFCLDANPAPPVDFGAPGIGLRVPWLAGATIVSTGNSLAAPHVTGLVARLLSKHPQLTPYEVKTVLRAVASNTTTPQART